MTPRTRFFALLFFGTVFQGCRVDMEPVGPNASRSVVADVMADGPEWGPWSMPINLGPLVNSPLDDNRPAISKDGLSVYITSGRLGGFGGLDIWVSHRASADDPVLHGAEQSAGQRPGLRHLREHADGGRRGVRSARPGSGAQQPVPRHPHGDSARRPRDLPLFWATGRRGQRGLVGVDASLDS